MSSREIHALAGRLHLEFRRAHLSDQQDWLLDRCFDELAYRWRTAARRGERRCTCAFCWPTVAEDL
jgi:hypothetical protein